MSPEDEVTLETLYDRSYPTMLSEDLDLPCKFSKSGYDQEKNVKFRITCNYDWAAVNWKKKKLFDEEMEPVTVKALILHIHGGGFMSGSSASSRATTIEYSLALNVPVISIDYRLAPDYKFPAGLSDCWQVYLWILKYSEKYLKLKPLKIVLMGDSAGGNLCLGVLNLAIQKSVKVPDGVHLLYPSLMCSYIHFVPSLLLSLDDPMLNVTFLALVLESYTTKEI